MEHRTRKMIVAMLAAGLLAVAGFSGTASANGDRYSGDHQPKATHTQKPKATHAPDLKKLKCTVTPAATPTAVPTPTAVVVGDDESDGAAAPLHAGWTKATKDSKAGKEYKSGHTQRATKVACTLENLQKSADQKIAGQIKTLQRLIKSVNGAKYLTDAQKAALVAYANGVIADLNALKTKIDAETTIEAVQADLKELSTLTRSNKNVQRMIHLVGYAQKILDQATKYDVLAVDLAAAIAAAPAGIDTVKAQALLDDFKAHLASSRALAEPIPAQLLALTLAQLQSGEANPVLWQAQKDLMKSMHELQAARRDAHMIKKILGIDHQPKATPTVAPTPTPTV
jgi:hypothetical protein